MFDETTKTLIKSLADYGHYVQLELADERGFEIGTDYAEMDAYYTASYDYDATRAAVADKGIQQTLGTDDVTGSTFSLVLDSKTAIRVYFTPAASYAGSVSAQIGTDTVSVVKDGGRYLVEIPGLSAHMLGKTFRIDLATDNGTTTVRVSALSYVKSALDQAYDATSYDAVCAIYAFSAAADAYKLAH